MQLVRFAVQGFKNFREEICLDELGPINIIHGDNNVGKSNLLEALLLFFQLGPFVCQNMPAQPVFISYDSRSDRVMNSEQVFNRDKSNAIRLEGAFRHTPPHASTQLPVPQNRQTNAAFTTEWTALSLCLRLIRQQEGFNAELLEMTATNLAGEVSHFRTMADIQPILPLLEQCFHYQYSSIPNLQVIRADRGIVYDALKSAGYDEHFLGKALREQSQLVSRQLAQRLVEASNALDPAQVARWDLFRSLAQEFRDIMQGDDVLALYDPRRNTSFLALKRGKLRIPVYELGTGVQQLLTILGHLCLTDATFIGIEEPELNLRYSLQERLLPLLEKYGQTLPKRQLFITSHSPAFESGRTFFALSLRNGAAAVERRPTSEAIAFTGMNHLTEPPLPTGKAANTAYISSDGVIRVPERILTEMGMPRGGGVVFIPNRETGYIELMTNAQFAELFESNDEIHEDSDA